MPRTDHSILEAFESCTLPKAQWDQRMHVAVAFLYLRAHGLEEALDYMRAGVQRINAAHGVKEGPFMGYNETTTVAFLHLVDAVRLAYENLYPAATAEDFCDLHPELMNKHVLRFFYSPDRRGVPEAKTTFVEPDLAPLPKVTPASRL